jgi:hypothetical protein
MQFKLSISFTGVISVLVLSSFIGILNISDADGYFNYFKSTQYNIHGHIIVLY